ncbi:MAG: hypothetical protein GXO85_15135, partial [Chlorobi bacterium]|nr:hypothetical protein [Chlorobiota bacterium]
MKIKFRSALQLPIILLALLFIAGCGDNGSKLSIIPEPEDINVNSG